MDPWTYINISPTGDKSYSILFSSTLSVFQSFLFYSLFRIVVFQSFGSSLKALLIFCAFQSLSTFGLSVFVSFDQLDLSFGSFAPLGILVFCFLGSLYFWIYQDLSYTEFGKDLKSKRHKIKKHLILFRFCLWDLLSCVFEPFVSLVFESSCQFCFFICQLLLQKVRLWPAINRG